MYLLIKIIIRTAIIIISQQHSCHSINGFSIWNREANKIPNDGGNKSRLNADDGDWKRSDSISKCWCRAWDRTTMTTGNNSMMRSEWNIECKRSFFLAFAHTHPHKSHAKEKNDYHRSNKFARLAHLETGNWCACVWLNQEVRQGASESISKG